jgi:hypothetical protein
MARSATPLNIPQQPGTGMAYVVRNVQTKKSCRASTTCQRDLKRDPNLKTLRSMSGEEPFFTAKVMGPNKEIQLLKFLCGAQHKKCLDETGTYQWLNISLTEARTANMKFDEQGYYINGAPTPAKPVKAKPGKTVKAKQAKTTKKVVKQVVAEVIQPTTIPAEQVIEEPIEEVKQSDTEFEAQLDAEHQAAVAKLMIATN